MSKLLRLGLLLTVLALAAGCGVVLKPSSATPASGALVAELAAAAGLPAGKPYESALGGIAYSLSSRSS